MLWYLSPVHGGCIRRLQGFHGLYKYTVKRKVLGRAYRGLRPFARVLERVYRSTAPP